MVLVNGGALAGNWLLARWKAGLKAGTGVGGLFTWPVMSDLTHLLHVGQTLLFEF